MIQIILIKLDNCQVIKNFGGIARAFYSVYNPSN
jgi:hypothetical protein